MSIIDLATLDEQSKQEATLEIIHPVDGTATGIKITVCSPHSERYQTLLRKNQNKTLQFMAKNKGKHALPAEMIEENGLELLIGCVIRWQDVVWSGTPVECTEPNVRMLFTKLPFIKDQVNEYLGDSSNFFSK